MSISACSVFVKRYCSRSVSFNALVSNAIECRISKFSTMSDTTASAILADPTRALQGTNKLSGSAMEESENGVGSLEQLLLYADEHYHAGKLSLDYHLGKVLHGVEEYHQRNVGR
ncbi:15-hydroxyprostaglandin dehydrogenase [Trichonephila clavipes]|nr:15-hydroxyprostaglandin dehydrogenase [Trichonephila clavipes]